MFPKKRSKAKTRRAYGRLLPGSRGSLEPPGKAAALVGCFGKQAGYPPMTAGYSAALSGSGSADRGRRRRPARRAASTRTASI